MHTHIGQGLRSVPIGEIHTTQFEISLHRFRMILARILHLVVSMQDAEETFCIDEGIIHIVVDAMQLPDGGTHIGKQHHVIHNLSDAHTWIVGQY